MRLPTGLLRHLGAGAGCTGTGGSSGRQHSPEGWRLDWGGRCIGRRVARAAVHVDHGGGRIHARTQLGHHQVVASKDIEMDNLDALDLLWGQLNL